MATTGSRRWGRRGRGKGLSVPDIVIAVVLSAFPVAVATGALALQHGPAHPGVAACLGVIGLTLPVAWRRPFPLTAAAVLAVAALGNGLVFGPLVRCGVALPAVYIVAFGIAARTSGPRAAAGLALCAADVVVEGYYDPQIGWSGGGVGFVLVLLLAGLSSVSSPGADPAVAAGEAVRALAAIEHDGRAALGQLRAVVGALRPPAADPLVPAEPQPTLARLAELLSGLPTVRARLIIEGQPRPLPAAIELSGYRIVEHLVEAHEDESAAVLEVRLRYLPEALELCVTGTTPPGLTDLRAILAVARQRAALHGGTVNGRIAAGASSATARLPLVSGYA